MTFLSRLRWAFWPHLTPMASLPPSLANEPVAMAENLKLLALQNQINPHFLYNTLEGIRSEALIGGVPSAAKMAELLATYFRYNISQTDTLVSIDDELANINNYFQIQKFRFEERLHMEVMFAQQEERIRQLKIPKLTLQPIVENAILHGIEPQLTQGWVSLRFFLYHQRLVIVVSDTGVGMPLAQLHALNQLLMSDQPPATGIGIYNVNTRLKLLFGEGYGLYVNSVPNQGTDVEIHLPHTEVSHG